jgi:methylated-DNA-[protein]-cysteine S-methyltransferase
MMMSEAFSYVLVPSDFGALGIVWQDTQAVVSTAAVETTAAEARVQRVFLPNPQAAAVDTLQMVFPGASSRACPAISELGEQIQRFLGGEPVRFDLGIVALERCSEFQRRVLRAEHGIPRGWVSTYGRIARSLGVPRGARAVGRALARNPFPIIVPCHRAIRSDGHLGGFQGGIEMKRALLEMEGVEITPAGRVRTLRAPHRFYY